MLMHNISPFFLYDFLHAFWDIFETATSDMTANCLVLIESINTKIKEEHFEVCLITNRIILLVLYYECNMYTEKTLNLVLNICSRNKKRFNL
jgi:hypothetical protein